MFLYTETGEAAVEKKKQQQQQKKKNKKEKNYVGLLSMQQHCGQCNKSYVRTHTCLAGTCMRCGIFDKNVGMHRCPVRKLSMSLGTSAGQQVLLSQARSSGTRCDGCGAHHPHTISLREFRGVDLCNDCYSIPEIMQEVYHLRQQQLYYCIQKNMVACTICHTNLIDPNKAVAVGQFELGDVGGTDRCIIPQLVSTGAPCTQIQEELQHCRLLCIQCHSIVMFLENHSQFSYVMRHRQENTCPLSPKTIATYRYTLDKLTRMVRDSS